MKYLLLSIFTLLSIAGFSQPQCGGTTVVTAISSTSAVLHYSAAANFGSATLYIEYSKNSNFIPKTSINVGSVSGNQTVSSTYTASALTPNTLYYWRLYLSTGTICNGTNFTTLASSSAPVINSLMDATPAIDSAIISYSINGGNNNTTSIIKYGLSSTTLTSQLAGGTVSGSTLTYINTPIHGLLPNTKYFYQIEATNIVGTVVSAINSFITNANATLINEFKFNNSRYDETNTVTFSGTGAFTTDRYGNTNNAKICDGTIVDDVTIANLPQGSSSRSISMWFQRTNNSATTSYPFYYGTNVNYQVYSFGVNTTKSTMFFWHPTSADPFVSYTTNNSSWYHVVITSTTSGLHKLYMNGVLINSATLAINTTGTTLKVGNYNFAGAVDDLKIYSGILTPAQVTQLYNNNVLPTTITQFTAIKKDNTTQLNWISENEINVAHFNIQRSTNGKDFETIGNIDAGEKEYNFIDKSLPISIAGNTIYYRLQVVDKDGSNTYSITKQITLNNKQQAINIFPSLATSQVNIEYATTKSETINIKIVDLTGKLIDTKNVNATVGNNIFYYDCSKLHTGNYFIIFSNKNELIKTKQFSKN